MANKFKPGDYVLIEPGHNWIPQIKRRLGVPLVIDGPHEGFAGHRWKLKEMDGSPFVSVEEGDTRADIRFGIIESKLLPAAFLGAMSK